MVVNLILIFRSTTTSFDSTSFDLHTIKMSISLVFLQYFNILGFVGCQLSIIFLLSPVGNFKFFLAFRFSFPVNRTYLGVTWGVTWELRKPRELQEPSLFCLLGNSLLVCEAVCGVFVSKVCALWVHSLAIVLCCVGALGQTKILPASQFNCPASPSA